MSARHVLAQQIAAEVAVEIAPHRVDVVAVVLGVVELDEKRRPLHAVVVFLAPGRRPGPREADVVEAAARRQPETTLAQLDGMKGSLPTALQQRIETARAALSAKQSASSMLR